MTSNNSKFWIISEIYYPVKTSTGYYVTEIAEYLAKKGMEVHVICTSSNYNKGESSSNVKEELRNGVHIHRVNTLNINKNQFIKRIIRLLLSSCELFLKSIFLIRKKDKVLIATNPAFLLLAMPIIKKIKGIYYSILVHDVFPENLVAIGKLKSDSFLYKTVKRIFDSAYRSADLCLSIGRDMNEVLCQKTQNKTNIKFIPIWSQNKEVRPIDKSESNLSNQLNLNDKFVFQFAGNLGHAQGIDNILQSIDLMKNENCYFLFIGGGAKYELIKDFSERHKKVLLLGFQDRSKQNDFLNACDVGIVTLNDGMYGLGVPSKSYNIMAAGKPILLVADNNSEMGRCVNEYKIGWIVEPDNPKLLAKAMDKIVAETDELKKMKTNCRTIAETIYAEANILEEYYQVLK